MKQNLLLKFSQVELKFSQVEPVPDTDVSKRIYPRQFLEQVFIQHCTQKDRLCEFVEPEGIKEHLKDYYEEILKILSGSMRFRRKVMQRMTERLSFPPGKYIHIISK